MPPDEGQLALDIFRDEDTLVIRSAVAGVKQEDLTVAVHGDLLTIRGKREMHESVNDDDWFCDECYWGAFSRSVVLPVDVYTERADAKLTNGLLEIRIPIREALHHLEIRAIEPDDLTT
mgnify:CR=1 FL=1